jgi:ubiquinone/menaquinone biosynthesis C-methylase UbiE
MSTTDLRVSRGIPPAPSSFSGWDRHFDAYADEYEAIAFSGAGLTHVSRGEIDAVLSALGSRVPGRVLDAGAGTGRLARELTGRGWQVTALDVSERMLERIGRELSTCTTLRGAVGQPLALPDDAFDAVVCMRVLKYVEDLDRALAEFARVLRPGGTIVLEWTNARSAARFGYPGAPVRMVSVRSAERAMRAAGLQPLRRVAGTRLPQPVWTRARSRRAARVAIAAERALATLLGGDRTCTAARSFVVAGVRM